MKKNQILITFCAVLTVLTIFTMIGSIAGGATIRDLESREQLLISQKRDLEQILVKMGSLNELSKKSTEFGFVKASDIVYIGKADSYAKLP